MTLKRSAVLAALIAALGTRAEATPIDLTGQAGTFQLFFPNASTSVSGPYSFTVGPGAEIAGVSWGNITWSLDIDVSTLTFGFNDAGCCTSGATFTGPVVTFTGGGFPGLSLVSLSSTNIAGFAASGVSFSSNAIGVNVQGGFDLRNNRNVVLSASGPEIATVPEPATLTLTALGLAGVVTRYRRRRSRPVS